MTKLRVLLISPVRNVDVYCGDVIYTETLLENPPDNVEYIDYVSALQNKEVFERMRLRFLASNFRHRKNWFFIDLIPALLIFFINFFRRKKLLIANPWKCLEIEGKFDLVHVHVFPVKLTGKVPPVVISNAVRAGDFLKNVNHFSKMRVLAMETIEKVLCWIFNIQETSLCFDKASKIILFSQFLKEDYIRIGANKDKLRVVPIGLKAGIKTITNLKSHINIGFIAKDFPNKGGEYLLSAYKELYKTKANLKLTIVGCEPTLTSEEQRAYNIDWIPFIPRDELMTKVFPDFDIFAYPTLADGLPLVVLEALSMGIPTLVSDILALPEMVGFGQAGEVTIARNKDSIKEKLDKMTEPDYLKDKTSAASEFFAKTYHIDAVRANLLAVYKECLLP